MSDFSQLLRWNTNLVRGLAQSVLERAKVIRSSLVPYGPDIDPKSVKSVKSVKLKAKVTGVKAKAKVKSATLGKPKNVAGKRRVVRSRPTKRANV